MSESPVIYNSNELLELSKNDLSVLRELAENAVLRRSRICMHLSEEDSVQEMVIGLCRDSYIRPHRHLGKSESYHIIEGELTVILFDETGRVTKRILMSANDASLKLIFRLSNEAWHMVIPQTEYVVIHEVTNGPFNRSDTEYASWAPHESESDAIVIFLEELNK